MDILSELLILAEPRTYNCGGMNLGPAAVLHLPSFEGLKCYAMISGEAWLGVEGLPGQVHIKAGECLLLTGGRPFSLAGSLDGLQAPAIDTEPVQCGSIATYGGGGQCLLVGAHFRFSATQALMLLNLLPPVVHLSDAAENVSLCWTLQRMANELAHPKPGGVVVAHSLARMMLVEALRVHIENGRQSDLGGLAALADSQIAMAMTLMHQQPGHAWTVECLAQQVGMSRAGFAARFTALVHQSPIAYLTNWRVSLAEKMLVDTDKSIEQIAGTLSYESPSAFGRVFAKSTGRNPKRYRQERSGRG